MLGPHQVYKCYGPTLDNDPGPGDPVTRAYEGPTRVPQARATGAAASRVCPSPWKTRDRAYTLGPGMPKGPAIPGSLKKPGPGYTLIMGVTGSTGTWPQVDGFRSDPHKYPNTLPTWEAEN